MGNKPNNIRKKALEHAKKGHWEKALEEFLRLVEVEQHNPNLFNEIGDIQLKLANKREAFKQYDAAIEAYAKVGLLNNAIAVCKKILRLNPADDIVYGRMATLRQSQGFGREAAAYALQFLERLMKRPEGADESAMAIVREIVRQVSPEPEVLERAAECFTAWDASGDAADALEKLERVSHERGLSAHAERARAKLRSMGRERTAPVAPAPESRPADSGPREPEKQPQTIEAHRPSAGAAAPGFDAPFNKTVPSHIRRGHGGDVAADFGVIEVGSPNTREPAESPVPIAVSSGAARSDGEAGDAGTERRTEPALAGREAEAVAPERVRARFEAAETVPATVYEIPLADEKGGEFALDADAAEAPAVCPGGESGPAAEVKADVEAGDYRSHYDLGMAYLEMHLLPEAIREFQYAAQSPAFKVRSLEMIGQCFITQKQPELAIKQLTMGLALVNGDDRLALGIKYSLALAYEMVGEHEKAKAFFQDVYVVDGSFRDIGEKIRRYAS